MKRKVAPTMMPPSFPSSPITSEVSEWYSETPPPIVKNSAHPVSIIDPKLNPPPPGLGPRRPAIPTAKNSPNTDAISRYASVPVPSGHGRLISYGVLPDAQVPTSSSCVSFVQNR